MGRTVMPGNCALMGATRLASGKMQCSYTKQRLTDSTNYTPVCKTFALITERGTGLLKKTTRDASPPLEVAFGPQDRSHAYVLPDRNTGEYTMLRSIGGLYVLHKKDSKFV